MPKVLVLYYSSYGHIEKMAEAVAEGARSAGAPGRYQARAGNRSGSDCQERPLQTQSTRPGRNRGRTRKLRCNCCWDWHAVRANVVADGSIPRPGRRFVGEGGVARQGRCCVRIQCYSAWRPGNDAVLDYHQPSAFWHDDRGAAIQPPRADEHRGDRRWCSLRCHYGCRRRWIAPADRDRLGRCTPSRRIGRKDGSQAFRLINNNQCRLREAPASRTRTTSVAMRPESKRRPSC